MLRVMFHALIRLTAALFLTTLTATAQQPAADVRPTVWLIGDSTVNNSTKGLLGWGKPIAELFDPAKVRVENRARGGTSSRSFLREGMWDAVAKEIQRGDFVLMQFGHNDGGPIDREKARASLKGNGEETKDVTVVETGAAETVHSYGWYLRHYAAEAKAKGATPIILSLIPRNIWKDGKVGRATNDYGKAASEAAATGGFLFVDLNAIIAGHYDELGQDKVAAEFFTADHTHTTPAGAAFNAGCVAEGIRGLKGCPLAGALRPAVAKTP